MDSSMYAEEDYQVMVQTLLKTAKENKKIIKRRGGAIVVDWPMKFLESSMGHENWDGTCDGLCNVLL